jgi:hypothetical protein
VEVAHILHARGDAFVAQHPWLSAQQRSVLRALVGSGGRSAASTSSTGRVSIVGRNINRCNKKGLFGRHRRPLSKVEITRAE